MREVIPAYWNSNSDDDGGHKGKDEENEGEVWGREWE